MRIKDLGLVMNAPITEKIYTYAGLTSTPVEGMRCVISDATVNAFMAHVSEGDGSYKVPVQYLDGKWVVA